MIVGLNFIDMDVVDIPVDTEYQRCNFAQPTPIDVSGDKRGVRLFPGDDTPRTFVHCNLKNCEPPPGSTLIHCNTWMIERILIDEDIVTVDGVEISRTENYVIRKYGRFNPDTFTYIDEVSPVDIPED